MLSTVFPTDSLLSTANNNSSFSFNAGFTPWEKLESLFTNTIMEKDNAQIKPESKLNEHESTFSRYHVGLDSGSISPNQDSPYLDKPDLGQDDAQSPTSVLLSPNFGSGSEDPNQNPNHFMLNSCADEPKRAVIMDEKKRKRMISNRESARRSRMQKQKHVEILNYNKKQLEIQTRERSNQLRLMTHHIQLVRKENERLKSESVILRRKLYELGQMWQLQQHSYHLHSYSLPPSSSSSSASTQMII
ncbi:unnamed protein product [Amaranthus hypochondriacus]